MKIISKRKKDEVTLKVKHDGNMMIFGATTIPDNYGANDVLTCCCDLSEHLREQNSASMVLIPIQDHRKDIVSLNYDLEYGDFVLNDGAIEKAANNADILDTATRFYESGEEKVNLRIRKMKNSTGDYEVKMSLNDRYALFFVVEIIEGQDNLADTMQHLQEGFNIFSIYHKSPVLFLVNAPSDGIPLM